MRPESNSQSKIDKNFVKIIELLNLHKIDYWLCHGTLLGIIRDNDLIPWDHDIDIAVWNNNSIKKKFLDIMIENDFILKEKYLIEEDLLTFIKEGGREVDINFYDKKISDNYNVAYIKWLVPKNNIMKLIDALSLSNKYSGKFKFLINRLFFFQNLFKKIKIFLIKKKLFYRSIGYTQPFNLVEKIKFIRFKELLVSVPLESEKYLEYVYGKDWKKPIQQYNWIKDSPSTKEI